MNTRHKSKSQGIALCLLLAASTVSYANHEIVVAPVEKDTYVRAGSPFNNDNYGCEPLIGTGKIGPTDGLIRFDLSNVEREASSLESAKLEASVWNPFIWSEFEISVHRVLAPWIEGRGQRGTPRPPDCVGVDKGPDWDPALDWAHWDNKPLVDAVPVTSASFTGVAQGDRFEWDVTSLVRSWLEAPAANFGLALREQSDAEARLLEFISNEIDVYPDFEPWDSIRAIGGSPKLILSFLPVLSCEGFEPPVDDPTAPVSVRKPNRALPFRAVLRDGEGFAVTDLDLSAPPVIQVIYESGVPGEPPVDVSDDALAVGLGTDGNQFVYTDDNKWQFNLKLKEFNAPGTYTVTIVAGDHYAITPTCTGVFVIE